MSGPGTTHVDSDDDFDGGFVQQPAVLVVAGRHHRGRLPEGLQWASAAAGARQPGEQPVGGGLVEVGAQTHRRGSTHTN